MTFTRLLVLLVSISTLVSCSSSSNESTENTELKNATRVAIAKPTVETFVVQQTSVGTIESLSTPTLAAEIPGTVQKVFVDVGDQVTPNQPLVQLDDELAKIALGSAQADIKQVTALIENQKLTVNRYRQLVKKQSQSRSILDEAETQLKASRAKLAKAQHGLEEAQYRLRKTIIRAPENASVQKRYVSVGDYLGQGSPVIDLVNSQKLRARLNFPETVGQYLKTGQAVSLISPTAPDQIVQAKIHEIAPMLDATNRAIMVVVDFDNPGLFKAGASVDGTVTTMTRKDAVLVPDRAVVRRPIGNVVYTIKDNKAHAVRVSLGHHYQDKVEILDGLSAEQPIATDGAGFLTDGAWVQAGENK